MKSIWQGYSDARLIYMLVSILQCMGVNTNIYCQCKHFQSSEGKTNMHDFQGQMKRPKMGSK